MPTYRTREHRTSRILQNWLNQEELAFQLQTSLPLKELQAALPESCKEQFGKLKPTDNTFRKMSSGFSKVSDIWLELMRLLGVEDFSPEQAIFGNVSVVLDNENVRVKLNIFENQPSRQNSIEVLCLNTPKYQGLIRYEGNRLSFPNSIFKAVIDRRLEVYLMNCEDLQDRLLIPRVSDPQSLLIAENNARLAEERRQLDEQAELALFDEIDKLDELDENSGVLTEDGLMDLNDTELAELEAARNEEAARDAFLEELADERDHNQLMGSLIDGETTDDAIALTPYDIVESETESDPNVQDQILAKAIQILTEATDDYVDDHGNSIYDESAANDLETTSFGSAVNREIYHKISFDERLTKDAAPTAESETKDEAIDDTDADAEIEAAVDGHGSEIDEVDSEIEDLNTLPQSVSDEVDDNEADDNNLYQKVVVGAADIRDYDLDDEF